MSSQSKQSVIDAMLRQMVLQPFLSAAKVIDVEGNVFAKYERSPNIIGSNWYLQLDSRLPLTKKIPFSNNDGYLLVTSDTIPSLFTLKSPLFSSKYCYLLWAICRPRAIYRHGNQIC